MCSGSPDYLYNLAVIPITIEEENYGKGSA